MKSYGHEDNADLLYDLLNQATGDAVDYISTEQGTSISVKHHAYPSVWGISIMEDGQTVGIRLGDGRMFNVSITEG